MRRTEIETILALTGRDSISRPSKGFAYQPHYILSGVGAIAASAARRFPCKELNCRERQISCKKPLAVWAEVCMIKK
jgi:hypothetical protein